MTRVLVLGGGPDAEREVSLASSAAVAEALARAPGFEVEPRTIDRPGPQEIAAMPGDAIFPVLHGAYGEGGALQQILETDGRPFVGSGSRASRLAMDKFAAKLAAAALGIPTPEAATFSPHDEGLPFALPVVVKPVCDGSSVGLHVCRDAASWRAARSAVLDDQATHPGRPYMVERAHFGRELTVGMLDADPLPLIEITPAEGIYDYEAKYHRDDTRYTVDPDVPAGVERALRQWAIGVCEALGVRHLARVDFLMDERGKPWFLEVNTIPGFTVHSLVPMAARQIGIEMPALCARLVELALRDG